MRLHLDRDEIVERIQRALRLYPEDRGRPMYLQVESEDGGEVLKLEAPHGTGDIVEAILQAYGRFPRDYVMVLVGEQIIGMWTD